MKSAELLQRWQTHPRARYIALLCIGMCIVLLAKCRPQIVLAPVSALTGKEFQQYSHVTAALALKTGYGNNRGCWQCIQPEWRQHFIFGNTTEGHLDACPDMDDWPPGYWTQQLSTDMPFSNVALSSNRSRRPRSHRRSSRRGSSSSRPEWQQRVRKAAQGEAAMLPSTLLAQHAIWSNQHPPSCASAKFLVYQATFR
jgi:hypothetical protein